MMDWIAAPETAYALTWALLAVLLLASWMLPQPARAEGEPYRWYKDLRLWATGIIVLQAGIYVVFS